MSVVQVGQDLIDEGHPQSEEFRALIEDLLQRWQELKDAVEARNQRLKLSEVAQQVSTFFYYYYCVMSLERPRQIRQRKT